MDSLSIVIPLWNEEALVRHTVATAKSVCDDLVQAAVVDDYELVLVDDGSTDTTGEIIDELANPDPRVHAVHHAENRGPGGALRTGLAQTTGSLILYTDADLPCDLAELNRACRLMRTYEADLLSAYRHDRTAEGPRRAFYSWTYNALIRLLFRVRVRDIAHAFKLFRREMLDHLVLRSESGFVNAELVIRAHRQGYRIVQIGIDFFPRTRGVSTLSSIRSIRRILREMIAFLRRGDTPQRLDRETKD